jgi:hypothetical protein
MKTMRPLFILLTVFLSGSFIFLSCNKNNSGSTGGVSHLQVMLTDAPADYDAVNIDIRKVEVKAASDTGDSGWQTVNIVHPGVYNLLNFKNGVDTMLAAADLPAPVTLSQVRLILGDNNSVVIDGQSYPLKTPSAQQSGLKLNIHSTLTADIVYHLWIDFDASRSIVATGSGKYILKPVIRTYADAVGGSVKGTVLPSAANPQVWATMGTDTLLALPDSTTGNYFFGGLNAGSWNLLFHARDSTYRDTAFAVTVTTGVVTNAGTVSLSKK